MFESNLSWKSVGSARWLDLLDKNPATIILIPIWCWKLTWVVEVTKWFIAVYNTLSAPVTALWGATRQIKGCYYKCYLHRTGLHQIWWIFSFCFCDIKPFRDFCEYFLFVTLDYIWIHPEYPDFILLLYCPPFDNIKIPGEQLCNTFLLTSILTHKINTSTTYHILAVSKGCKDCNVTVLCVDCL